MGSEQESQDNLYDFYGLPRSINQSVKWESFDSEKSYIGILDTERHCCYIEEPQFFKSKEKGWTLHSSMMKNIGKWKDYKNWTKDPVRHYAKLHKYCGFAYEKETGWVGQSCTLNVAHNSGQHDEVARNAIQFSGQRGQDEGAKNEGLHQMPRLLWEPLEKQLVKMTKKGQGAACGAVAEAGGELVKAVVKSDLEHQAMDSTKRGGLISNYSCLLIISDKRGKIEGIRYMSPQDGQWKLKPVPVKRGTVVAHLQDGYCKGSEGSVVVIVGKEECLITFGCPLAAFFNFAKIVHGKELIEINWNKNGHPLELKITVK